MMIGGRRSGRPWPENRPKRRRKRKGIRGSNGEDTKLNEPWFHYYESLSS
jgi:hypothetical protein